MYPIHYFHQTSQTVARPFLRTDDSRYLVLTDVILAEMMKKLRVLLLVWKMDQSAGDSLLTDGIV